MNAGKKCYGRKNERKGQVCCGWRKGEITDMRLKEGIGACRQVGRWGGGEEGKA